MSATDPTHTPEATRMRVRRLIQELARRIQDRRPASVITRPVIPRAPRNHTPPANPPSPARSAPPTQLRRLVADCPKPPQRRKVSA